MSSKKNIRDRYLTHHDDECMKVPKLMVYGLGSIRESCHTHRIRSPWRSGCRFGDITRPRRFCPARSKSLRRIHTGYTFLPHISISLRIVSYDPHLILNIIVHTTRTCDASGVLDYVDGLNDIQIRKVFKIFSELACGDAEASCIVVFLKTSNLIESLPTGTWRETHRIGFDIQRTSDNDTKTIV